MMEIMFCNSNDKKYQALLNNLLKDVFLDFQFWYDLDLWNEDYESYSIMEDDVIISNICLYKTQILYKGKKYSALSVGAVATREGYKGRGYSRRLMEHIIDKYDSTPMYLSANDGVVDFYPRFGFKRVYEKLPVAKCNVSNELQVKKLGFKDPKIWDYVHKRTNYSPSLDCISGGNINIFHIYLGYLHDSIYEIEELDTLIIANQRDNVLKLIAVFSLKAVSFSELIKRLPFRNIEVIEFGFMPYWDDCLYTMTEYEHDPLFVRDIHCNLVEFKFPELAIT